MLVDLHTHSTFSDGRYTPTQLVEEAAAKGIVALALADHDSWNGVEEAKRAAEALGNTVRIIPAVELGAQYGEESVHILAYYVDMTNAPLLAKMNEMRHAREFRLLKMLEKLHSLGYEIEVEACDPKNRAVGRPHVAKALVAKGYFSTFHLANRNRTAEQMRSTYGDVTKLTATNLNIFVKSKGYRMDIVGYFFVFYNCSDIIFHDYFPIFPITVDKSFCIAIHASRAAS